MLLAWANTAEGELALAQEGYYRLVPGEAVLPVQGQMRVLREMSGEDLLTWQRLQLEAASRLRGLPTDGAEALHVLNTINLALVSYALDCSADDAARLAPSVRRRVVEIQDRLNQSQLVVAAISE